MATKLGFSVELAEHGASSGFDGKAAIRFGSDGLPDAVKNGYETTIEIRNARNPRRAYPDHRDDGQMLFAKRKRSALNVAWTICDQTDETGGAKRCHPQKP